MKAKTLTCAGVVMAVLSIVAGVITTEVDPACAGMGTVTAVGKNVAAGKSQAIKATAAKGCVFAGWYTNGVPATLTTDYRNPSSTFVATEADVTLTARFAEPKDDVLDFTFEGVFESLDPNADIEPINVGALVESVSLPTLTFTGLPAGLKYDAKTLMITGCPTKPGDSWVTVSGKNASGYQYSEVVAASVQDISAARVSGSGETFTVGDELTADDEVSPDYYFSVDDTDLNSVTYSGWPTGLSVKNGYLVGKFTKSGSFVATATAKYKTDVEGNNKATTEKATATISVSDLSAADFDCLVMDLENLQVGVSLAEEGIVFGSYRGDDKTGVTSLSGLPAGLTVSKVAYDAEEIDAVSGATNTVKMTDYVIGGTPTKAGLYKVTTKLSYMDDETGKKVDVSCVDEIIVAATPSYYVSAVATNLDAQASGTVTGAAVVQPGTKVTLKATAAKGSVFAGWYAPDDTEMSAADVDYRNPARTFSAGIREKTVTDWVARFVTAACDSVVEIANLDDLEYDTSTDDAVSIPFSVLSYSLPTVKASGLPSGFAITIGEDGEYLVTYDPATAKKTPTPGVYTVTVTATNVSKAKAEASFTIRISNWVSDRIQVSDSYGEFTPGEEIDPIDWSQLVKFANGETVKISGLPKGLSYTEKAIAAKGKTLARTAYSVYGTPTVPGDYTVTIAAKVIASVTTNTQGKVTKTYANETATTTFSIAPFPALTVSVDADAAAAGCKVTGAGNYIQGSKVTLKATAAKGWVFAGWTGLDEGTDLLTRLNPSLSLVTGADDVGYGAAFVTLADDGLYVDDFDVPFTNAVNVAVTNATLILDLVNTVSLPSISVSGLPTGLKFDAKTCLLSGKPTKSGISYATVTAKNAGGYSYVRVLKMVILNADGSAPEEAAEVNTAEIDFSALDEGLVTGVWYDSESESTALSFDVPEGDYPVKKVAVKGLPTGLTALIDVDDWGDFSFVIGGVASKPGRYTITVDVSYEKGTAKAVKTFTVHDGGSMYVDVASENGTLGTVTGSGVYAAGATVKISAKAAKNCVFAGWLKDSSVQAEEEGKEIAIFDLLTEIAGVDYRTANVSFPLVTERMPETILGAFVASSDDNLLDIVFDDEEEDEDFVWEISDLNEDASTGFSITSASLPKLTVSGLPKGVSVDAVDGVIFYDSTFAAKAVPGVYTVKFSAQNQFYSTNKLKVERTIRIVLPNKTSEVIWCDSATDAYPLTVGMSIGDAFDGIEADEGYTLSVSGLPAGVTYKNGEFSGVPSKAGDYTVTLTAKQTGCETETATITVSVSALPAWAVGNFTGSLHVKRTEDHDWYYGTASIDVTANGKISGKLMLDEGETIQLSYAAFTEGSEDALVLWDEASDLTLAIAATTNLIADAEVGQIELERGDLTAALTHNEWKKGGALANLGTLLKGKKITGLRNVEQGCEEITYELNLEFAADGVVKVKYVDVEEPKSSYSVSGTLRLVENTGLEGEVYKFVLPLNLMKPDEEYAEVHMTVSSDGQIDETQLELVVPNDDD